MNETNISSVFFVKDAKYVQRVKELIFLSFYRDYPKRIDRMLNALNVQTEEEIIKKATIAQLLYSAGFDSAVNIDSPTENSNLCYGFYFSGKKASRRIEKTIKLFSSMARYLCDDSRLNIYTYSSIVQHDFNIYTVKNDRVVHEKAHDFLACNDNSFDYFDDRMIALAIMRAAELFKVEPTAATGLGKALNHVKSVNDIMTTLFLFANRKSGPGEPSDSLIPTGNPRNPCGCSVLWQ